MDARETLRYLIDQSGKPKTTISTDLGKSQGYINSYLTIGRAPGVDVLANIADVCGYDLVIVNRETGQTTRIDPQRDKD